MATATTAREAYEVLGPEGRSWVLDRGLLDGWSSMQEPARLSAVADARRAFEACGYSVPAAPTVVTVAPAPETIAEKPAGVTDPPAAGDTTTTAPAA